MHRLPRPIRLRRLAPIYRHPNPSLRSPQRRLQSQIVYRPSGEPVRYRSVRFKKPGWSYRRLFTLGIYAGATYAYLSLILRHLDVEIEILEDDATTEQEKEVEGEEGEDQEDEEGPFYAEEDSTFVPLTWATRMPRTFYRGSDPEWQEFVKVAKDKPRHKKIQTELVQIVFTGSTQHPSISRQLGKDPKVGKYWLDISFPDGPPQEYERSGIEIGDGFIAWSQQKVSQESQWRTMRALWPSAAFDGLWTTSKVLAGIQYRRVKQALGWEDRDPLSPEERYRHAVEMMEKQQQQAREGKGLGKAQTEPDATAGTVVGASAAASQAQPAKSPASDKKLPWQISVPLPSSGGNSLDVPIAMHVFSSTLSKSWNPKKAEPPRGTFVVQGLVEVRGQKGRMLFDVQSAYDPKAAKFVQVNAAVRNFKRWNQAPRGGP